MSRDLTKRKRDLTSQELSILQLELEKRGKSKVLTYFLWWFLGLFGGHRFYLGNIVYAIAMFLFGWMTCGIWWLVDVFFLSKKIAKLNAKIEDEIINNILAQRRNTA